MDSGLIMQLLAQSDQEEHQVGGTPEDATGPSLSTTLPESMTRLLEAGYTFEKASKRKIDALDKEKDVRFIKKRFPPTQLIPGRGRNALITIARTPSSLTAIELLPTEVIEQIVLALKQSSAICLALTSHTLAKKVADPHWWPHACLKGQSRLNLLRLLKKDHPTLLLCEQCQKFHCPEPLKLLEYSSNARDSLRKCEENAGYVRIGPHSIIKFLHAQAVVQMCTSNHIPYPSRLSFINCHEIDRETILAPFQVTQTEEVNGFREEVKISARVIKGKLIICTEGTLLGPASQAHKLPVLQSRYACSHYPKNKSEGGNELELGQSYPIQGSACSTKTQHSCRVCPTDSVLEKHTLVKGLLRYEVTSWRDLGSCSASTNPKWSTQRPLEPAELATFLPRSMHAEWGFIDFPYKHMGVRRLYEERVRIEKEIDIGGEPGKDPKAKPSIPRRIGALVSSVRKHNNQPK